MLMADDYINKDDSFIGTKVEVATKIHCLSRLQQKDAMASDSRRNKVRTTTIISTAISYFWINCFH